MHPFAGPSTAAWRPPAFPRQRRSAEIRDFLRSRRARLTPADVGMPAAGLRREEVAVLAGVGVSWYRYWQDAARAMLGQYQADAARCADDPEFDRLATDMCAVSPAFAEIWAEHHVGSNTRGTKVLDHPEAGELLFEYTMLPLPDLPGPRLLLHSPHPDDDTAPRLADLLAEPVAS
ncbi:hypothetical protein F1721_26715 [Saccharopolyspora hirsuta]|uniref:MmyB-like transcription regulator ligand binding domain-containing protein n=1 Tax=Saccharopolyspora hirsuta TaxID=1837 RepID=A0A5M7BPQ1_SACHI|nr:hypothetical protein [Saccharopolyspora hirsuta]KAA5829254.1 hypothetical protein F1721_26715 [Saccharopolyspora hirsuta]